MAADDDMVHVDELKPFNMRTGRKRNGIWRYFDRYERKTCKRGDENNVIHTKTIAKCTKCNHVSSINLDFSQS